MQNYEESSLVSQHKLHTGCVRRKLLNAYEAAFEPQNIGGDLEALLDIHHRFLVHCVAHMERRNCLVVEVVEPDRYCLNHKNIMKTNCYCNYIKFKPEMWKLEAKAVKAVKFCGSGSTLKNEAGSGSKNIPLLPHPWFTLIKIIQLKYC